MSRTAQEWKELLNLEALPDDEFLAALNELEGKERVSGGGLEDRGLAVRMGFPELLEALLVEGVGLAFKHMRTARALSTRDAAQTLGLSQGRVSQVEQPGANLELATIADLAERWGYRTRVVFEPIAGGPSITAKVENLR